MKDKGVSIFEWSTKGKDVEQRFSEFEDVLKMNLIKVTTTIDDTMCFWCDVSAIKSGLFSITDISGSAKRSQRSAKDIACNSVDEYHLIYATSAWGFINRHGQEIKLPAGSVFLLDTRKEYTSLLQNNFLNRTLALPAEWLATWVVQPEMILEKNLNEVSGWGRVLASYLGQLSPGYTSSIDSRFPMILDQIGGLLALILNDMACYGGGADTLGTHKRYQRILDSIHQRHMNLALTAADIARDVGVSTRTLHRIMASEGTSFGQELIRYRAQSALRMLNSREYDRLPVMDIARRAGFIDSSHFYRVCKTYFGKSPGKIRKER
jgi:AraC family transcriptional activator of tynA and feaB